MLDGKKIAVVVPAHNEERLIGKTLSTMPAYVDSIIVVNDGSTDQTAFHVEKIKERDPRIIHIQKIKNEGLGKGIVDGYKKAHELKIDVVAVMAGDAQMDPDDLEGVVRPIIEKQALYVKGNRLLTPGVFKVMPKHRFWGNSALTFLTKFATGYFHLMDPQCGYTAIAGSAIPYLDLENPHKGYGYNAHLLYQLNLHNAKVVDVEVKPVYGEAVSGIRLSSYIPRVSWLLLSLFIRRVLLKYFIFDFHPVGLCYVFCACSGLLAFYTGIRVILMKLSVFGAALPLVSLPTVMLCVLASFAFLMLFLFAILLDTEYLRSRQK